MWAVVSSVIVLTASFNRASSSLDMRSDAIAQRTLRSAFEGCTVLVVAHRISCVNIHSVLYPISRSSSTVINLDRIIVMDAGRIVEQGSPQELLALPQGHFRRLAGTDEQ